MAEFEEIRAYFDTSEWNKLTDLQKRQFVIMKTNYDLMSGLGLNPAPPVFMKKPVTTSVVSSRTTNKRAAVADDNNNNTKTKASRRSARVTRISYVVEDDEEEEEEVDDPDNDGDFEMSSEEELNEEKKNKRNNISRQSSVRQQRGRGAFNRANSSGNNGSSLNYLSPRKTLDSSVNVPTQKISKFGVDVIYSPKKKQVLEYDPVADRCPFCGFQCNSCKCGEFSPRHVIRDKQVRDVAVMDLRAHYTVPDVLELGRSRGIKTRSVFAKLFLRQGIRFGPYCGERKSLEEYPNYRDSIFCWEVRSDHGRGPIVEIIDGFSLRHSNWMRFVTRTSDKSKQNLISYQLGRHIFFQTMKDVRPGEELFLWSGDEIVEDKKQHRIKQEVCDETQEPTVEIENCESDERVAMPLRNGNAAKKRKTSEIDVVTVDCETPVPSSKNVTKKVTESCVATTPTANKKPQKGESGGLKQLKIGTYLGVRKEQPRTRGVSATKCNPTSASTEKEEECSNSPALSTEVETQSTHAVSGRFACSQNCSRSFKRISAKAYHSLTDHFGAEVEKCNTCINVFFADVREHCWKRHGKRMWRCSVCYRCFSARSALILHRILKHNHHSLGQKPRFKCSYCSASFAYRAICNCHIRWCHNIRFHCALHRMAFNSLSAFNKHCEAVRKRIRHLETWYPCKICCFGANTRRRLNIHLTMVHNC